LQDVLGRLGTSWDGLCNPPANRRFHHKPASVSNDRLKAAISNAGLTPEQLADLVQVDIRTMDRWLSGRTPYRRHRSNVARGLGVEPHELWPDTEPDPATDLEPAAALEPPAQSSEESSGDPVDIYLGSHDPRAPDRLELLKNASQRIDILGLTLADLITGHEVVALLADRAAAGCEIRILLAAPDSVQLIVADQERHHEARLTDPPSLAWDVERALGYLQPLLTLPTITIRTHTAAHINTILCVDDQLLAALHIYSAGPDSEPIMHLTTRDHRGLFFLYAEHFRQIWHNAGSPLEPDAERYPDPEQIPDRYRPLDHDRTAPRWGPFGYAAPK
jgi:lambda repressor-like predicted transcriptional regulator